MVDILQKKKLAPAPLAVKEEDDVPVTDNEEMSSDEDEEDDYVNVDADPAVLAKVEEAIKLAEEKDDSPFKPPVEVSVEGKTDEEKDDNVLNEALTTEVDEEVVLAPEAEKATDSEEATEEAPKESSEKESGADTVPAPAIAEVALSEPTVPVEGGSEDTIKPSDSPVLVAAPEGTEEEVESAEELKTVPTTTEELDNSIEVSVFTPEEAADDEGNEVAEREEQTSTKVDEEMAKEEEDEDKDTPLLSTAPSTDMIERARSEDPIAAAMDDFNCEPMKEVDLGEWSGFSKEVFALDHMPGSMDMPHLLEVSDALNESLWKRYFDSRCLLSKVCEKDDEAVEKSPSQLYREDLKTAFIDEYKGTPVGNVLGRHTYQRATNVTLNEKKKLESATVVSTIFSPFFLPRAIQLCMRYHRKPNDFWCTWHIQFVSLKDEVQDKMQYWRPHLTDMWELCSNGYAKMPTMEIGFTPVEEIDTDFLSPNMVRKIRKWLLGSLKSDIVDDFSLMKFLFASTGVVEDFELLSGDIGYTWTARDAQAADMILYKVDGKEVDHALATGTNWLEFQCRMVTTSFRGIDKWYDPYDSKYYKGKWGEKVMAYRFKKYGTRFKDPHVLNGPHKVWDLAHRGIMFDTPAAPKSPQRNGSPKGSPTTSAASTPSR